MPVCSCCNNYAFVDLHAGMGKVDMVVKSKIKNEFGYPDTEIRVTLDNAGALALIDSLIQGFPELGKRVSLKG